LTALICCGLSLSPSCSSRSSWLCFVRATPIVRFAPPVLG
jgi:hypothetical protein